MTVKIELTAEMEAALAAQARTRGMALEQYLARLLQETVSVSKQTSRLSPSEKAARWLEGSKLFPVTPPLSDEAVSRESIYEERG